jgi:CO dehydrogenase maturation factor
MRIAVVGKGGSGKTTVASVVARTLARRGEPVVALDGDTNANLGISLGLGLDATEGLVTMRERLDAGEEEHARDVDLLLERFGCAAPDGVRLAVVTRIESPEPGCPCCGLSVEQVLTQLEGTGSTVVADLEAGLGTLSRLRTRGGIDTALIVAEPTPTSIEVGVRAARLARENGVNEILVVANRVRGDEDLATVRQAFEEQGEVAAVPDDPAIVAADREGVAPLDADPGSPAVRALEDLAGRLGTAALR